MLKTTLLAVALASLPLMAADKKAEPASVKTDANAVSVSTEDSAALWRLKATASDAKSHADDVEKQAQAAVQQAQQQAQQVEHSVAQKFAQIAAKYGCSVNSFKPSSDQAHPEKMTCEKTPAAKK